MAPHKREIPLYYSVTERYRDAKSNIILKYIMRVRVRVRVWKSSQCRRIQIEAIESGEG